MPYMSTRKKIPRKIKLVLTETDIETNEIRQFNHDLCLIFKF